MFLQAARVPLLELGAQPPALMKDGTAGEASYIRRSCNCVAKGSPQSSAAIPGHR